MQVTCSYLIQMARLKSVFSEWCLARRRRGQVEELYQPLLKFLLTFLVSSLTLVCSNCIQAERQWTFKDQCDGDDDEPKEVHKFMVASFPGHTQRPGNQAGHNLVYVTLAVMWDITWRAILAVSIAIPVTNDLSSGVFLVLIFYCLIIWSGACMADLQNSIK